MTSTTNPPGGSIRFLTDLVSILVILLLGCALFAPTLIETANIALHNDDYSHGLVLPIVVAYLLYDRRFYFAACSHGASRWLVWTALLIFGLTVYLIGFSSQLHFPMWISLFPTSIGCIGLIWGTRVARGCASPMAVLYMAKPLPDVLMPKLFGRFQNLAAQTSAQLLEAAGIPTYLSGNIIEVPGIRLLVEEACSGMRSVITLLTVALIILALHKHRIFSKISIIALSLLFALILNVIRVTATGILAYEVNPALARGFMHTFSGLITFVIGFILLYGASRLLARFEVIPEKQTPRRDL